jgi:hypothetical protein
VGAGVLHVSAEHPAHHGRGVIAAAALGTLIVGAALLAAWAPLPEASVAWWHTRIYLPSQSFLTGVSNQASFALLDAVMLVAVVWLVAFWGRRLLHPPPGRRARALAGAVATTTVLAACTYLVFLGVWGLNYRRPPLGRTIDHDAGRVDRGAVERIAERAVAELNGLHLAAHAAGWPDAALLPSDLAAAFAEAQQRLGTTRLARPGRPKTTWLGAYFVRAAVAGMIDPFFLEVMITPDALPFERPAILAHEWAHLAGFASEAEASFVGWLTCMQGDASLRYSGWFELYPRTLAGLPAEVRKRLNDDLEDGPRADYAQVATRLARASPMLTRAAWSGYDRFLKANRMPDGVAGYDAVAGLVAGTSFVEEWRPRLRDPGRVDPSEPGRRP